MTPSAHRSVPALESPLTHPTYRPDIDGLRGIAVLSVVAFHAAPKAFKGGFVGVDIFFVISGFLIASIILANLTGGTFSFAEFYARRVRRIFPALLTVLLTCAGLAWLVLLPDEFRQLGKHVAGGAGFIANFLLWAETGYFDAAAETKPLLHLWSLGIEEQFYIVFPFVLWLAWRWRANALWSIAILAAISFAWNLTQIRENPAATFFLPLTRFWELLAGAWLAALTLRSGTSSSDAQSPLSPTASQFLSMSGLALLLGSILLVRKEAAFPGFLAAIPVTGAALLIFSGPHTWINRHILSSRLLVGCGLISYPLYLWHWPLLSYARIVEGGTPSSGIRLAAVSASVILAWGTYRLIEQPLRFGAHRTRKAWALAGAMLAVGLGGLVMLRSDGFPSRLSGAGLADSAAFAWDESLNRTTACQKRIGLLARHYCVVSDDSSPPGIAIIGDSNANHLYPGMVAASAGRPVLMAGQGGCAPLLGMSTRMSEGELECQRVIEPALRLAATSSDIKTVVLAMMGAAYATGNRSLTGGTFEIHPVGQPPSGNRLSELRRGLRDTLQFLAPAGKSIILVLDTPRLDFSPKSCVDFRPVRLTRKKDPCAIERASVEKDNASYRQVVAEVLKEFPKVRAYDPLSDLCDDRYCHAMRDGRVLFRDEVHLSVKGSELIARKITEAMAPP